MYLGDTSFKVTDSNDVLCVEALADSETVNVRGKGKRKRVHFDNDDDEEPKQKKVSVIWLARNYFSSKSFLHLCIE